MSMRLAVNCPFCKRPMATSVAQAGQMVACPSCRGEFVLNSPAVTPPSAPQAVASPPRSTAADLLPPGNVSQPATASRIEPMLGLSIPAATAIADAPDDLQVAPLVPPLPSGALPSPPLSAPVPPSPPARTARLKTAASSAPAIAPAADGKLPALQLADDQASHTAEGGEKAVPLWLACVAIAGSTVLSVFLLLGDAPAQKSVQSRTAEVRQDVAGFFGSDAAALRPYQVLLREAQQAHSRGDHASEKQRYRQVLALLRSEKRSRYENVTGTPGDDERLAELLSILLSAE